MGATASGRDTGRDIAAQLRELADRFDRGELESWSLDLKADYREAPPASEWVEYEDTGVRHLRVTYRPRVPVEV